MQNKRYFYSCPIKAAYMAQEFKVKFIHRFTQKGFGKVSGPWEKERTLFLSNAERIFNRFWHKKKVKIYVCKESEAIFEPKEGDYDDHGNVFMNLGGKSLWRGLMNMNGIEKSKIIMRDNKQFFSPLEENESN